MVLRRLLGSSANRLLTVGWLLYEVKRSLDRGRRLRALAMLAVAAVAWKWVVVGLVAQSVVQTLRRAN